MAAWGKYKKVSSCKLKVSGKDWLLPNIQSRKQLAFAAAGGEEMVSSKSQDSFVRFHQSPLTESPKRRPSMIFRRT